MFAVVKTGGKQYKVSENDVIRVEKLAVEAGASIDLDQILMVGDEASTTVGAPLVEGALVKATVLEQARAEKVIVFKKKRRKGYRRTHGHRQELTVLRITEVLAKAAKSKAKAKAEPKAEPKTEAPASGDAAAEQEA
jgi:large subunit ribosomal protein L21